MLYQLSYFRKSIAFFLNFRLKRTFFHLSVGEDGFEPPKAYASRFTVCPIWPLWYSPFSMNAAGLSSTNREHARDFSGTKVKIIFEFCKPKLHFREK